MTKKRLLFALTILCGMALVSGLAMQAYGQAKPKTDPIILKGSPMGGVKFEHAKHVEKAANKCETCHHASKPEKAATAPQQSCQSCHTKTVTAPMKTNTVAAFHKSATAAGGVCIDCHKAEAAKGAKAPTKCMECHKKENA